MRPQNARHARFEVDSEPPLNPGDGPQEYKSSGALLLVGCLLCLTVRSFTRALLVSVNVSHTSAVLKLHQTTINYPTNTRRQMAMECRE